MSDFLKAIAKAPLAAKIGMIIVALNIIAILFAPLLAPYGETEIVGDPFEPGIWGEPTNVDGKAFLIGTDQLGRDLLSRMLYGARNTISLAMMITIIAFFTGIVFGFLAATLKGKVDQIISRMVDIMMAFPSLIFGLLVLSVTGPKLWAMAFVIVFSDSTRVFRLARAVAMDVEVMEYVEAAKLRGEGIWWIMTREILPNTLSPLIAEFGLRFCFVFLFISALSFLGLGLQPPTADWGGMVREMAEGINFGILSPLFPAAAIAFLTIGVNLVVDWFLHKTAGIREEY